MTSTVLEDVIIILTKCFLLSAPSGSKNGRVTILRLQFFATNTHIRILSGSAMSYSVQSYPFITFSFDPTGKPRCAM